MLLCTGMDSAQFQGITMAAFFAFSHDRFRLSRATDLQSFYSVPTRGQIAQQRRAPASRQANGDCVLHLNGTDDRWRT